jgi:cyanophycin synthetase
VSQLLAQMLILANPHIGVANTHGLYLGPRKVHDLPEQAWELRQRLLMNRQVTTAVFENPPRHILTEGLVYDRCQVGVVTGVPKAHGLEDLYITEDEQMFNVVRTQVDVVLREGVAVINALEPAAADLADLCDGEVIYCGGSSDLPHVAAHLAQGGRAVLCVGQQPMMCTADQLRPVFEQAQHPCSANGTLQQILLTAVATAWALEVPLSVIRAGIDVGLPTLNLSGN